MGRRTALLVATATLVLLGSVISAATSGVLAATGSGSSETLTSPAADRVPVSQLKIMNYYPADAGWTAMWTAYSHTRTVSDFQAIASLGANTVRLIVQPRATGYPTVSPAMAAIFADMLATAKATGLSVQLTLFDWWGNYTDIAGSQAWLHSLLDGQAGNTTIALVELQNELPVTNSPAMSWAGTMLPFLSTVLPGVPRTISASGTAGLPGITTLLTTFGALVMDVADVHYYGDAANAATAIRTAQSSAGGRQVIVGETGMNTLDGAAGEEAQARFFGVVARITQALGVPTAAPWILSDFTATGILGGSAPAQYHYGLRRVDGSLKPAAAIVRNAFAGTATADIDGGFENEVNGSTARLGAWTPYASTYGVGVVSHDLVRSGTSSLCFSGTTAGSATPSVDQNLPVLSAGRVITATGYVFRLAPTGGERIALGWFDANGAYLGQTESPFASTSGSWQQLKVSAAAPAGAATVQVHLKASNESGRACYDDVTVSW